MLKDINDRLYTDLQDPAFAAEYLRLATEEGPEAVAQAERDISRARRREAIEEIKKLGKGNHVTQEEIKAWKEEGRP